MWLIDVSVSESNVPKFFPMAGKDVMQRRISDHFSLDMCFDVDELVVHWQ